VADSSNQVLLLIGWKRSLRPPTKAHPFGYGVERYFWSFVVSVNIFLLGAVFAIYEGVDKIMHPHAMEHVLYNYLALGLAMLFEGLALRVAWGEFQHWRVTQPGSLWKAMRDAKDLSLPTVIFEDTAALIGLVIATAGVTLAHLTHNGIYDGMASILIGGVLLSVAWFLARESYSLLLGEAAGREDRHRIRVIVAEESSVERLIEMGTLQRGPDSIIVALTLSFRPDMNTAQIGKAVMRLEAKIRAEIPEAKHIFIEVGALRLLSGDQPV
jgi:cation diffusion facilitator family transporter